MPTLTASGRSGSTGTRLTTPTRRTRTGSAVRPIALSGFTTRTETIAPPIPRTSFRPRRSAMPTTTSPIPCPANSNGSSQARGFTLAPQVAAAAPILEAQMTTRPNTERLDTDGRPVTVGDQPVSLTLSLAPAPARAVANSFTEGTMRPDTPGEPDGCSSSLRTFGPTRARAYLTWGCAPRQNRPMSTLALYRFLASPPPRVPVGPTAALNDQGA